MSELRDKMRASLVKAEAESNKWSDRKRELQSRYSGALLRIRSGDDLTMADALNAWSFHERNAKLYAAVLAAEVAALQLSGPEILPIDWQRAAGLDHGPE